MASAVIHILVANELNKYLKRDPNKILIGSIAPDISKIINEDRKISHFINSKTDFELDKFLEKYSNNLDDDFVLGYYIHLYTDYLWFKKFLPKFVTGNTIHMIDGTIEVVDKVKKYEYIYGDYTSLNVELIDEYNLNLSIFYEECPIFKNIINEIPIKKIPTIINEMKTIIENSKKSKTHIFNLESIKEFINLSVSIIKEDLQKKKAL